MLLQIECHKEREKKSLRKLHNSTVEDETFFHAHTLRLCYFISKSSQVNDALLITNIIWWHSPVIKFFSTFFLLLW